MMSTCPKCFEDMGCTCDERKCIAELEDENKRLRGLLEKARDALWCAGDDLGDDIEKVLKKGR